MLARGLLGTPRYLERVVRALPSTLPNLEDAPILSDIPGAKTLGRATARMARALRGRESRVLERTTLTRPRTSFNGRVSPHRRFAFGQLSLDDVKAIKNAYGCTVNDVVVAHLRRRGAAVAGRARRAARGAAGDAGARLGADRGAARAPTATGSG